MRNDRWRYVALALTLAVGLAGFSPGAPAADKDQAREQTDENATKPEHSVRPLPADAFNPSEEISEDFPVPFPVDI